MVRNEKGIALVTTLMLTLIGLGMILCLLYMITGSTRISGTNKRYKTVLEATYGGADILIKDIVPYILRNYSSTSTTNDAFTAALATDYAAVNPNVANISCLREKITKDVGSWSAACKNTSPPVSSPDLTLNLQGTGANTYQVYAKIVSTKTGNTSMGGLNLEGAAVADTSNVITPQHQPYLYTIEAQGQRSGDSSANTRLEVLYAY